MTEMELTSEMERGSSPASRGAAGAYIEGELGALYLLALLTGNRAPGMPDARVVSVRFQGIEHGFKLDDLIVFGGGAAGDSILEIQSKRDITFSPGDGIYQDVAFQIARSVVGSVPEERHLLGIATQRTSRKISGAYQDVLKWSRTMESATAFLTRLGARGVASKDMRDFVTTTRKHLVAGGAADEDDAIWRLLRRMLILEFDFEATSPITRTYGHALARMALADEDVGRAEALWSRLVDLSIKTGTTGGEVDRTALISNLAEAGFRLAGGREYGEARIRLAELAQNTLAHIGGSLAGVSLPRLEAVAAVDDAFEEHRFVEVRGDPGVGKSWVLRHLAERFARHAPIIVLDRDATPPGGWLPFSNALGIPGSAFEFLTDLAASGGAILFIDGMDMFDDVGRQRTIAELMRAASAIPDFRVIATTRTASNADVKLWLDDQIVAAMGGTYLVQVGPLSEDEVAILVDQAPDLRSLLDPKHPAAGLTRNLYRLSRLLKVPGATGVRTEAAMAGFWWRSADGAPANEVRAAQRLVATLAASALQYEGGLEVAEDSAARSHLIGTLTLREVRRDWLDFYHDVLRDWAIGSYIAEHPQRLAALDLSIPVSPRVARGIEFSARLALESGADCSAWIQLLEHLSVPGAHGSWRRQAILALPRSEAGYELLEKCSAGLLADGETLLVELCTTIAAVETVATADLIVRPDGTEADLPRSYRTDVTGSSLKVLRWVVAHASEISMSGIGAVLELIKIQLPLHEHLPIFARQSAVMLFGWLRQLDVRDADVTIPVGRKRGRAESEWRSSMIEQLRLIAILLGKFAPDELKAYLREVASEQNSYKVDEIRRLSKVIAPVAPAELAELVSASLLQKRERPHRGDRIMKRAFTFADSSYLPPSPAQPPFLDLLESAPAEGLMLIRTLVAESIAFSTDARVSGNSGFTVDFGDGPRFFPRANSYLWSRDQCREYSVASGLKALEAWSQQRLDDGVPVDQVLADILGPEGSCAAYLLVAVDVLLSHLDVARNALAPFIAAPELLTTDHLRWSYDQRSGMDQFAIGKEPESKVRLADLKGRLSRRSTLFGVVHLYLGDDPVANQLREQLGAAVAKLEPIQPYSNWGDVRFIARVANNRLQQSNWAELGDGKLGYRPPPDEVVHLEAMERQRVAFERSTEIEALIRLAIDGEGKYATAATARDAVAYAGGDLPDDSDTDFLKSRSTRLIATALLVARDGDDSLLAAEEAWVRQVVAIALEEYSDRSIGSTDALEYNRPAIAILTLIHIWARRGSEADRNALLRLATREDRSAAPAFSAGLGRILKVEPKLFKAAMRAAFASLIWRWKSGDEEDGAEDMRFGAERAAAIDIAVTAEIAWLDGESEPAWPAWPEERPILRRGSRIQLSGLSTSAEFGEDETIRSAVAEPSSIIRINSKAAAQWLAMVQAAPKGLTDWRQEVIEAYVGWTARMNGLGLPLDIEIEGDPHDWNLHYYTLFAERLLDSADASFEADLKLVTDLPDKSFGEVGQTVIHSADMLYCNDPHRSATRPADLRSRLANRVMTLQKWRYSDDPASSRIDMQSGGIIAKIMLNTYSSFSGTYSYLPPNLFDRVDPLLPGMRPLLPGGPTAFVALCTMNLLLVATHARHIDFLLEATEAWFGRTQAAGLWIDLGIGRKVVQWLEVAIIQEPGLLGPAHPFRVRIDRAVGRLVGVGVAEAHDLELKIEAAALRQK
ncbi:hypothetical protein QU606_05820 [Pseudomonas sp. OVF7]|uniref:hypothetical protein n=1 Tax=Pseudomonas TaxID=286 RepID=UPI00272D6F2D|nr:hypothetical protein [Pseudomonas sp. OVF7]WLD68149.1 hypothetical protein QU606_05820 [Pseudomonas sp. OVF7]